MTMPSRIVAAGAIVLGIALGLWIYLQWPRWYGAEVLLTFERSAGQVSPGPSFVSYPDTRLQLDATNTMPEAGQTNVKRITVRSIGVVWDSRNDPDDEASRLRNRRVYLQVTSERNLWRVVSVSTTLVPDVLNIAGQVEYANRAGQMDVNIAVGRLPIATTRAPEQAKAILRVLPSGRVGVIGIIQADGARVMF